MTTNILLQLEEQLKQSNDDLVWIYHDEIDKYNCHTQYVPNSPLSKMNILSNDNKTNDVPIVVTSSMNEEEIDKKPKVKCKGKKTITPLDIILQESNTFETYQNDIKEKLIEEVSQKEYSKVFGTKKISEIVSAITNNRWNKSIALFISFLFDKTVKYNNADILYNSEKNKGIIMVS
jgi:hypothetical protein